MRTRSPTLWIGIASLLALVGVVRAEDARAPEPAPAAPVAELTAKIAGTVVDETGRAVPFATVFLLDPPDDPDQRAPWTRTADAEGRFVFQGLGARPYVASAAWNRGAEPSAEVERTWLTPGDPRSTVRVRRGTTMTVRVNGVPRGERTVVSLWIDGEASVLVGRLRTDADGVARFGGLRTDWRTALWVAPVDGLTAMAFGTVSGEEPVVVTLAPGGTIRGRGVEADGFTHLRIVARGPRSGMTVPARLDDAGGFEIAGLVEGAWTVDVKRRVWGAESVLSWPARPGDVLDLRQSHVARGPSETLEAVDADFAQTKHLSAGRSRRFLDRYRALGPPGATRAKEVAATILREIDPTDEIAHETLGHRRFPHTLDELDGIAFRKYDYIRAVEDAITQPWFEDEATFRLALDAWEQTVAHQKRLDEDPSFRALDTARAEISRHRDLRDYNYAWTFASPYLLCYATTERVSAGELARLPYRKRREKEAELEASRARFALLVAEKARVFTQLYTEFLRCYGESCDLRPLMDPWGGRADLPPGKRTYQDGLPLVVWIFSDRDAWDDFHNVVRGDSVAPSVLGFFAPRSGEVFLRHDAADPEVQLSNELELGAHQLLHWFRRQKRDWGSSVRDASALETGLALQIAGVTRDGDRLVFDGVNRPILGRSKPAAAASPARGRKVKLFALQDLLGFADYSNAVRFATARGFTSPVDSFRDQSWALVRFLNEFDGHRYRPAWDRLAKDLFLAPRHPPEYMLERFKQRMGIRSGADWKRLQSEFERWYTTTLLPAVSDAPELWEPSELSEEPPEPPEPPFVPGVPDDPDDPERAK